MIKVEHAGGDEARVWPPHRGDMGASFLALNAGKRGIVVDLKAAGGSEVVADLVAVSDVLVENFKTGDMEGFGLGYDELEPRNPRLVYTSISAFGRVGPRASEPGYEAVLQAYSGVMAATGEPDGGPARTGPSVLDMATGVFAAFATVAALLRREHTGVGGLVETSLSAHRWGSCPTSSPTISSTAAARIVSGAPTLSSCRTRRSPRLMGSSSSPPETRTCTSDCAGPSIGRI